MEIISLKCNHCSADLEIPKQTKFFNCSFCKSSLTIKQSGNAVFTEVLDEIKADTDQILEISEAMHIEQQIERLDRDWEQTKAKFTTYDSNGKPSTPSGAIVIIISSFIVTMGAIFIFSAVPISSQGPEFSSAFTIIIAILLMLFIMASQISKSSEFEKHQTQYKKERQSLLNKLENTPKQK